jgi:hypothetical protein
VGRCFFDFVGVFGMKRISIPEYAQRLSHLTTLGGQHGQESEEGEEGEERSEEDCEEDPQGREEEEVSLAFERIAGGLMPARHSGLQAICFARADTI